MNNQTNSNPDMQSRRYVWIIATTMLRWLWKDLAKYLANHTNLRPVFLVATEQDRKFYTEQFGEPFEGEIVVRRNPYSAIVSPEDREPNLQDILGRARVLEKEFNITLMRDLILSDRHVGRGFMPAGSGHPKSSTSERSTLGNIIETVVDQFQFCAELMESHPPKLVVGYYTGGGIQAKPISLFCRKFGIPFRNLTPARIGGLMFWADDEYEGSALFSRALNRIPNEMDAEEIAAMRERLRPSSFSVDPGALAGIRAYRKFSYVIRQSVTFSLRRLYGNFRGYAHALTGYKWRSTLAMYFRMRRQIRELDRVARRELPSLEGQKIVYFPLQQEPEASTLVLSPEHTNQMATVLELALSLPANAVLVVKEHIWQMGRRPDRFYDALLEVPNLILMHPEASSREIIDRASLVCTLTSSAGFEAAALGIPVVFFWRRSPIQSLPHVYCMSRFQDIDRIPEILDSDTEEDRSRRVLDGARYLAAIDEFCTDFDPLKIFGRQERPNEHELEVMLTPLLESLPEDFKFADVTGLCAS